MDAESNIVQTVLSHTRTTVTYVVRAEKLYTFVCLPSMTKAASTSPQRICSDDKPLLLREDVGRKSVYQFAFRMNCVTTAARVA